MIPSLLVLLVALALADDPPADQLTALAKEGIAIDDTFHAELKAAEDDKAVSDAFSDNASCAANCSRSRRCLTAHSFQRT